MIVLNTFSLKLSVVIRAGMPSATKPISASSTLPLTKTFSMSPMVMTGEALAPRLRIEETGLPIVTEVVSAHEVEMVAEYADMLQVGTRNMQNFTLLKDLGKISKPIMLKRGLAATVEEWLMAAEYIVSRGNMQVILCERGIKTFERATRYTLDLSAVPVLKHETHLPVIVDPSHAAGKRDLVLPLARAAVAAGDLGAGTVLLSAPDAVHDGEPFGGATAPERLHSDHAVVNRYGRIGAVCRRPHLPGRFAEYRRTAQVQGNVGMAENIKRRFSDAIRRHTVSSRFTDYRDSLAKLLRAASAG